MKKKNQRKRLSRIVVKKLFDRYNYDIDLDNGYDVAILIAPNGCGKTTIFTLIDFMFNATKEKYEMISKIPFGEIVCTFSNGDNMKLVRNKMLKKKKDVSSEKSLGKMYFVINDNKPKDLASCFESGLNYDFLAQYDEVDDEFVDNLEYALNNGLPMELLERGEDYLKDYFINLQCEPVYDSDEYYSKNKDNFESMKKYSENYDCSVDVTFIRANRLEKENKSIIGYANGSPKEIDAYASDPLDEMRAKLRRKYNMSNQKYRKLVSEACERLPEMYLNNRREFLMSKKDFLKKWNEYQENINKYYELGLIDSANTIVEKDKLENQYEGNGEFLSVYLEAFKDTLKPWAEQYGKLKLFADIINGRNKITGKVMRFGSEGLVMYIGERKIDIRLLSSGEKNDLIMFYKLIFASKEGGIVLIDEPEISLHIAWQEEYLDYLLKICELNGLQAIVATHSPNIVNGHFELYADRGLQDEYKRS